VVEEVGFQAAILSPAVVMEAHIVAFVADHSPSVVLFDVSLPYDQNLEMFQRMRENALSGAPRWIALSTEPAVVRTLKESGELVVGKPFQLDELTELLSAARRGHWDEDE